MSTLSGMRGFVFVSFWQLISVFATDMTRFALGIWAYESTGSATALGLVQVFHLVAMLLASPFAGVWVDRYNRKLMMALSDLGAGLATLMLLALYVAGALHIWHLYAASLITGLFAAFQWPAYSSAISLMLPKQQLSRANGVHALQESVPRVFAPLAAGALLPVIGLPGILAFDALSFSLAVIALVFVLIPRPQVAKPEAKVSLWRDALTGFGFIIANKGLLGIQLVFMVGNFFYALCWPLLPAFVLARTAGSETTLATVASAGALGSVFGSVFMSTWVGFRKRVHGVLLGHGLMGLLSNLPMGLGQGLVAWAIASLLGGFLVPIMNASNQAIWQSKVPPELQGRVFAARRLIAWSVQPVGPILGGLLADNVLEPGMRSSGSMASSLGWLFGSGPGAGLGVLFATSGVLTALAISMAARSRRIRDVETRV